MKTFFHASPRCLLPAICLFATSELGAATSTWAGLNPGGAAWEYADNWLDNAVPAPGSTLVFGGSSSSYNFLNPINLTTDFAVDSLRFDAGDGDFQIGGSTFALANGITSTRSGVTTIIAQIVLQSSQTWDIGTGTLDVSAHVSGDGAGLTKSGAGTLILSASNTYSGGTTISAGTLKAGNSGLGSGDIFIHSDATLDLNSGSLNLNRVVAASTGTITSGVLTYTSDSNDTLPVSLTGAQRLTKFGTGTLTLTGTNSSTDGIDVRAGTINMAASGAFPSAGTIRLSANSSLEIGSASLDLARMQSATSTSSITSSGSYFVDTSSSASALARLQGSASLTKDGTGSLSLNSNNTYTGDTTINAGTVFGGTNSFGTGTIFVGGAATIDLFGQGLNITRLSPLGTGVVTTSFGNYTYDSSDDKTLAASFQGGGSIVKRGTGILTLTGTNTYTGVTSVSAGMLIIGSNNNGVIASNFVQVASGATFGFYRSGDLTYGGAISGAGILEKWGVNTLTLTGTNTYGGGTNVYGGTLLARSNTALGSGPITMGSWDFSTTSVTFDMDGNSDLTFAHNFTVNGGIGTARIATLGTANTAIFSGALELNRPTILHDGTGGRTTFTGVISGEVGTLSITTTPGGRVTLEGVNTFNGSVAVADDAILQITSNSNQVLPLTAGVSLSNSGRLWVFRDATIGSLAGGADSVITIPPGAGVPAAVLSVGASNSATTFGGRVGAGLTLNKIGSNTLTLTGGQHDGAINVAGGTLRITAPTFEAAINNYAEVTFDVASDGAFNPQMIGTGRLTKEGVGILALGHSNTYSGGTFVNGGLLQFALPAYFGSGTITLNGGGLRWESGFSADISSKLTAIGASGGSLDLNGESVTFGTALSGGALTVGGGTLNLPLANSLAGIKVTSGSVRGSHVSSFGTGTVTLDGSGASALLDRNAVNGGIHTNNYVVTAGSGSVTIGTTAPNDTGTFVDYTGTLQLDRPTTLVDAGTGPGGRTTFNGVISGNVGTLTISGGRVALGGANTFTGGVSVTSGSLLQLNGNVAGTNQVLPLTAQLSLASGSILQVYRTNTIGSLDAAAGSVIRNSLNEAATLILGHSASTSDTTYGGTFESNGSNLLTFVKNGSGTLTLSGLTTASGGITAFLTMNGGTLRPSNPLALQGIALTLNNSSALDFGENAAFTIAALAGSANVSLATTSGAPVTLSLGGSDYAGILSGPGSVRLPFTMVGQGSGFTGDNTYTGGTTISAGTFLSIGLGTPAGSVTGNIVNDGILYFQRTTALAYGGVISGSGNVRKFEASTLTLSGANTYTGGTSISAGAIRLGHSSALGTGTITLAGGTLNFGTLTSFNAGGLAGTSNLPLVNTDTVPAPVALSVGSNNASTTYSGILSGAGSLTKTGTGTLTLSSNHTYTGGTTVSAGTLRLGAGSTSGLIAGNVFIDSGATLDFDRSDAVSFPGTLTGLGNLAKHGAGTLTLPNANSLLSGDVNIAAGTVVIGNKESLGYEFGNNPITISSGATLNVGSVIMSLRRITGPGTLTGTLAFGLDNVDRTINTTLTGTARLNVGPGVTLTLTGNNSYTGPTAVNGTLVLGSAGALPSTGAIEFGTIGALRYTAANTTDYSSRFATSSSSSVYRIDTNGQNVTLASNMSASAFAKIGAGTLTLSGSNTFTNGTTINGGLVQFSTASNLSATGNITIDGGGLRWAAGNTTDISNRLTAFGAGGATFDTNGNNVAFATAHSGGGVTKAGAGILTVNALNTYTGGTTVSAGTLRLNTSSNGTGAIRGALTIGTGATVETAVIDAMGYNTGTKVDTLTINGGTLSNTSAGSSGWGIAYTLNGATMLSNGGTNSTSAASNFSFGGPGGGNTSVAVTGSTTSTINGLVVLRGDNGNTNVNFDVASGAALTVNAGLTSTNGATGLTKLGAGTMTLTFNNTYTGGTTVSAGTLALNGPNTSVGIIRGALTIKDGGIVDAQTPNAFGYGGGVKIDTVSISNGGQLKSTAISDQGWGVAYTLNNGSMLSNGGVTSTTSTSKFAFGNFTTVTVNGTTTSTIAGHIDLRSDLNPNTDFTVNTGATLLVSAGISTNSDGNIVGGTAGFTKKGAGTMIVTAANTYNGGTTIAPVGGKLLVNNTTGSGLGSGIVAVSGGTTIGGSGSFTGALTLNGAITPGSAANTVGALGTGAQTWNLGSSYLWEINNATGTAGTGWDFLSITGGLTNNAIPASRFTINITSLNGSTPGNAANFNSAIDQHWIIATTTVGWAFSSSQFAINTAGFTNAVGPKAWWSVSQIGNSLQLNFTAIPEPRATAAAVILLLGFAIYLRRQKVGRL